MRKRKSLIIIAAVLLTVMGAMLFISLFGEMDFSVEAFQFRVSVQFTDKGLTQVEIPPLGVIKARTHLTPVKIIISLENIDLQSLKEFIAEPPQQEKIIAEIRREARQTVAIYALKLLGLSAIGGAFGMLLLNRRGIMPLLKGAVIGLVFAVILLAGTYFTYDQKEFENPKYEGVLRAAPWMISLAEETFAKIETLGQKLQVVSSNLYDLFKQINQLKPLTETPGDITVLHVSDIHNNPAGIEFMQSVARLFEVDLIIDTGDMSDFGTPLEAMLLDRLKSVKKPYIFIPGNHDSPKIVEVMQQIAGITVLDGLTEVKGLRIMGFPDPSSYGTGVVPPNPEDISRYVTRVEEKLSLVPADIDILALHNNHIAERLAGTAPVIVFGHNHRLNIKVDKKSVLLNAGTSGASGLRGLQSFNSPYSLILLHFRPVEEKMKLVAADSIKVSNLKHGFTLKRTVFNRNRDQASESTPVPESHAPEDNETRRK